MGLHQIIFESITQNNSPVNKNLKFNRQIKTPEKSFILSVFTFSIFDRNRSNEPLIFQLSTSSIQPDHLAHIVGDVLLNLCDQRSFENCCIGLRVPENLRVLVQGSENIGSRGSKVSVAIVAWTKKSNSMKDLETLNIQTVLVPLSYKSSLNN